MRQPSRQPGEQAQGLTKRGRAVNRGEWTNAWECFVMCCGGSLREPTCAVLSCGVARCAGRRYFSGEIEFGVISQASYAFSTIESALSVIVNNLTAVSPRPAPPGQQTHAARRALRTRARQQLWSHACAASYSHPLQPGLGLQVILPCALAACMCVCECEWATLPGCSAMHACAIMVVPWWLPCHPCCAVTSVPRGGACVVLSCAQLSGLAAETDRLASLLDAVVACQVQG